jgi:hypothetical protein
MTTSVGHRIIDLQLLELDYLRVIEPPTIFNSAISRSGGRLSELAQPRVQVGNVKRT